MPRNPSIRPSRSGSNYENAWNALKEIDPHSRAFETTSPSGYVPTEADIARLEAVARAASIKRVCDFAFPNGQPIGERGTSDDIRQLPGGLPEAQKAFDYMSSGGVLKPIKRGLVARLPGDAGYITFRSVTSTYGSPAVDINIQGLPFTKFHY